MWRAAVSRGRGWHGGRSRARAGGAAGPVHSVAAIKCSSRALWVAKPFSINHDLLLLFTRAERQPEGAHSLSDSLMSVSINIQTINAKAFCGFTPRCSYSVHYTKRRPTAIISAYTGFTPPAFSTNISSACFLLTQLYVLDVDAIAGIRKGII